MKKGFTIFTSIIIAVCLISMISVSANDTGYGQFGKVYFGATADEATTDEATGDEATFDEASFDEASPDEWWGIDGKNKITVTYISASGFYEDSNNTSADKESKIIEKKIAIKKQNSASRGKKLKDETKVIKNKTEKLNNTKNIKTQQVQKITPKKTANTAIPPKQGYTGWILLGASVVAIVAVLIIANRKRKA